MPVSNPFQNLQLKKLPTVICGIETYSVGRTNSPTKPVNQTNNELKERAEQAGRQENPCKNADACTDVIREGRWREGINQKSSCPERVSGLG